MRQLRQWFPVLLLLGGCGEGAGSSVPTAVSQATNGREAVQTAADSAAPVDASDAQALSGEPTTQFVVQRIVASRGADSDWPRFRGPSGQGKSADRGLPVTWSPESNIIWKTALPGAGTSSPIVIADRIFLTCYSGYGAPGQAGGKLEDLRLHVVCLNRGDGQIRWTRELTPALPEQDTIRDEHGYASSTPVADSERVYCFFGKSGVFAFTHEGEQLWHAEVGTRLNGWGSAASPVLVDELLIVNASVESETLFAFDRKTGREVWRAGEIREAWNTPTLLTVPGGQPELIVPVPRSVMGLEPSTGKRLWTCDTGISWYMVPSVVTEAGVAYCTGGRSGDALAVRAGGRGDVTHSHRLWTRNKGSNVPSPILHEGHLYWMHENQGIAFCVNATSGEVVYETRIPRADQVYASSVYGDGKIYYLSRGGRTFVVAAKPEFQLLATNELEPRGRFDASPAIVDSRLLIRSNRFLYCIGDN